MNTTEGEAIYHIFYCGTKEERPAGSIERAFVIAQTESAACTRLAQKFDIPEDQWDVRREHGTGEGFTIEHYMRNSEASPWMAEERVREQLAEHGAAVCFEEEAPPRRPPVSAQDLYGWAPRPDVRGSDLWRLGSHVPVLLDRRGQ